MRGRGARAWLVAGLALVPPVIAANEAPEPQAAKAAPEAQDVQTPLDAELLEFLGSMDDMDEQWTEYLARTDIAKIARSKRAATPKDDSDD